MTLHHKMIWAETRDYLFITLGLAIYTIAFTVFLMPYQIVAGGVTGLSAIIYYATGFHLENTYIIINGVLLLVALKILGVKFMMKTIFAIFTIYFMLMFAQELLPKQDNGLPIKLMGEGQDFMSMIIGCVLTGIALATVFTHNGSTGGTDIIAAMINKYRDITLGRVILLCDIIIVTSSIIVLKDWEKVIYGYVVLWVVAFCIDQVINSRRSSVQFFIISEKYKEIAHAINTSNPHRGVTVFDGQGYYSGNDVKMLFVLAKRRESPMIFSIWLMFPSLRGLAFKMTTFFIVSPTRRICSPVKHPRI